MAKIVPPMNFGLVEEGTSTIRSPRARLGALRACPVAGCRAAKQIDSTGRGQELTAAGFYRSAQPSELNFSFLEKLNLKSVIWVGAEEPSDIL